jgi:hypothetical protein
MGFPDVFDTAAFACSAAGDDEDARTGHDQEFLRLHPF